MNFPAIEPYLFEAHTKSPPTTFRIERMRVYNEFKTGTARAIAGVIPGGLSVDFEISVN